MRYALIDDDATHRALFRRMLASLRSEATCAGEAEDGERGLELLRGFAGRLDIVFLDIEFPPDGAFGLLQRARAEAIAPPRIAFVTAYDHFAVEAFRWVACDYLVKPVARERLQETLARLPLAAPDVGVVLQALRSGQERRIPERFTVHARGRLLVLSWSEVSHLTTEDRLLHVHSPRGHHVLDRTLDELESVLAPRFLRIHRSTMIALDRVRELCPDGKGGGDVVLDDGTALAVSRDRMALLRKALQG